MIIGIGCIALDHILVTEAHWKDEKGRIIRSENRFGGNIRNSLVALGALGMEAAYLGTMSGEDQWHSAFDDFAVHGVSTEFVDLDSASHPAEATVVITGDAQRFIVYDDTPLHHIKLPSSEKISKALENAKLVMVDGGICPEGTLDIIRHCKVHNIPVVLDAEQFVVAKPTVLAMIEIASDLILPISFSETVTGEKEISKIFDSLWNDDRNIVVITDGANGCYFQIPGEGKFRHLSAFKIDAVDTNGTGDIFHACYAYGILNGLDAISSLRFASAGAASVAKLEHGEPRLPNLEVIKEFMEQNAELLLN